MHLSFLHSNGSEVYDFGSKTSNNAKQVVRIERLALINEDIYQVILEVWNE